MEMPHATASNPKMMYKNSGGVLYIRVSHAGYRETTPIAQPEAGSNSPDYEWHEKFKVDNGHNP